MVTKKKTKTARKKVTKKKAVSKISINRSSVSLVSKLKKSKISKSAIARACGLKSHNSVTYWFKVGGLPMQYTSKLTKLLSK